jgi:hypothetical protein
VRVWTTKVAKRTKNAKGERPRQFYAVRRQRRHATRNCESISNKRRGAAMTPNGV